MINLDFSLAISVFSLVFLAMVFILWLSGNKSKDKELLLDDKLIWFCSVCTYTYVVTKEETISTCPRCGSYNKKTLT